MPVLVWTAAAILSLGLRVGYAEGLMPADGVVTDAGIYTGLPRRGMAEALAIENGTLLFAGNARDAVQKNSIVYAHLDPVLKARRRITERLNRVGIAGMLHAMAAPEGGDARLQLGKSDDLAGDGHAKNIRTPMCS
jgi:hypothetical protein